MQRVKQSKLVMSFAAIITIILLFNFSGVEIFAAGQKWVRWDYIEPTDEQQGILIVERTTSNGKSIGGIMLTGESSIIYYIYNQNKSFDTVEDRNMGLKTAVDDNLIEYGKYTYTNEGWVYDKMIYSEKGVLLSQTSSTGKDYIDFQEILDKAKNDYRLDIRFSQDTEDAIFLVYGPYRVYSYTTIASYVSSNYKPVLKKMNKQTVFINTDESDANVGGYLGSGNIYIADLDFDINRRNAPVIKMAHGEGLLVSGCSFYNGTIGHVIELNSVKNAWVKYCSFKDIIYRTNGTKFTYANYFEGELLHHEVIQIEGSPTDIKTVSVKSETFTVTETRKNWSVSTIKADDTVSQNIYIQDNSFENVIRGVGGHYFNARRDPLTPQLNIHITGNSFKDIKENAISLEGYKNVSISENKFYLISNSVISGKRIYMLKCTKENDEFYTEADFIGNNYYYSAESGKWLKLSALRNPGIMIVN